MDNSLHLIPGKTYCVVQPFTDYDGIVHKMGERWQYRGTNFLPYDDGLILHVLKDNKAMMYRLQWREEEQAHIIENFKRYVQVL